MVNNKKIKAIRVISPINVILDAEFLLMKVGEKIEYCCGERYFVIKRVIKRTK